MCKDKSIWWCVLAGLVGGAVITSLAIWVSCMFKEPTPQCECDKAEYDELMFEYKALLGEKARLEYQCSGVFDLQEAYEDIADPLPYYVPVDIQEPLPYVRTS